MAAIEPVEDILGDKNLTSEEPKNIVAFINFGIAKVLRKTRSRLNDLLQGMKDGKLTLSGQDITVGAGIPASTVSGLLYIRTDGGAGTTLYVKEGAVWVGK
jgi:hypothetical protein